MAQATGFSLSVPPGFRGLEAADVAQLAIAGGRDAEAALKGAGEVERAVEAAIGGDFGDRLVAEVKQAGGLLETGLEQPSLRGQAGMGLEQAAEVVRIEPAGGRPRGDCHIRTQCSTSKEPLGRASSIP
jgi:hypothetical protein